MTTSADEFKHVASRIETLTNVLHHMNHKSSSTKCEKHGIPPILRHFANLLTYGGNADNEAENVIAVTGTFEGGNKVKVLVVTQNHNPSSNASSLSVKRVPIGAGSFDDIITRPDSETLEQHIQDICIALTMCSPNDPVQLEAVEIFIVSRCYRKLRTQFDLYEKKFGVGLDEQIREWDSGKREVNAPEWIDVPGDFIHKYLSAGTEIKTQTVKHNGEEDIQCEFSDDTKGIWSQILADIIAALRQAFKKVDDAKLGIKSTEPRPTDEERKAYKTLTNTLFDLYLYVQYLPGLAEKLLTGTTVGSVLANKVKGKARDVEESEDTIFEPNEDTGQYVLRYLRTIIAWHHAVHTLTKKLHRLNINDIDIRLVEIPFQAPSLLTVDEIKEEYTSQHPNSKDHIALFDDFPSSFSGTVHAEAMLMGLLAYFTSDKGKVIYDLDAKDLAPLQEIIKPVNGNDKYIAVGKECCWCCSRLAQHLGQHIQSEFKLPGTHGIFYAWSPPRVGVDVSVLKALEKDLWEALGSALYTRARPSLSRQSSVPSDDEKLDRKVIRGRVLQGLVKR